MSGVRPIQPASKNLRTEIQVPPSKSYTNRALIAAALGEGDTTIVNPSLSDDSLHLLNALKDFGITIKKKKGSFEVQGSNGTLTAPKKEVFIGNAGTAMRFLTTLASLAQGETVLTGDEQMQQRPIQDLLDALKHSGIKSSSTNGCPPVTIHGGNFSGGRIDIRAEKSSQFISSLLLTSPYAKRPVDLFIKGKINSLPYVDMTLHVMRSFGAEIDIADPSIYRVSNKSKYIGHEFHVESDASSATYFLAAAAITGGTITIPDISPDSLQGDVKFIDVLSEMGCSVTKHEHSLEVTGKKLRGIEIDMNNLPDCVPALAVVAAFAEGSTTITNIPQLRYKETDRIAALAKELSKMGVKIEVTEDGLIIHPGKLHGTTIETYNDHRIAMSFAVAGLCVEGMTISHPECVAKSFPTFWDEFKKLESGK